MKKRKKKKKEGKKRKKESRRPRNVPIEKDLKVKTNNSELYDKNIATLTAQESQDAQQRILFFFFCIYQ